MINMGAQPLNKRLRKKSVRSAALLTLRVCKKKMAASELARGWSFERDAAVHADRRPSGNDESEQQQGPVWVGAVSYQNFVHT
jgi:hypothetical protein